MPTEDDERARIRALLDSLTARFEVVLDDVVLRTWGDPRPDLTLRLLADAVADSGGDGTEEELRPFAEAIARGGVPAPQPVG